MIEHIYIGKGSISHLSGILKLHPGKKIFLVTGKSSYGKSGAQKIMESLLEGTPYFRFFEFEKNPKLEDVEKGIALFNKESCELTIAIGGGSVIDIAKLINSLSKVQGNLEKTIRANQLDHKPFPFAAIPTTAGSGSEATHFAVMYINGEKYSFAHKYILPEYVFVDSQFTYSTKAYLTACTGADAFCQGLESMWANQRNTESKGFAEKAIQLVWNNLEEAVLNNDPASKDALMEGAYWAGKAINISKTTVCHALSYKMTSLFDVPHGHAVALTLVQVMKANYEDAREDIHRILRLINAKNLSDGAAKIEKFWEQIGLCMKLSQLGIEANQISKLLNCNLERLKNNPAVMTKEYIENIFRSIL